MARFASRHPSKSRGTRRLVALGAAGVLACAGALAWEPVSAATAKLHHNQPGQGQPPPRSVTANPPPPPAAQTAAGPPSEGAGAAESLPARRHGRPRPPGMVGKRGHRPKEGPAAKEGPAGESSGARPPAA